jgi:hypothetical protein
MAGLFIKLDVDFWDHPKIVTAGIMAGVLYQRMSMYCMQHTTDGFVPAAQLPRFALPATGRLTAALVDVGLIEPAGGGWVVPGYIERYQSATELERRRQIDRENGRKGGRPRNPTETQGVSDEKPRGLSVGLPDTKPRRNQEVEVEVEVEVEEESSSDTSAARPPVSDDDDLPERLWAAAGIARPGPTQGDRRTIAAARHRGWQPDQLLAKASRAAQAEHDRASYLRSVLTDAANSDPPTEHASPTANGETRDTAWAQVARFAAAGPTAWTAANGLSDRTRRAALTARTVIKTDTAANAKWAFFAAWDAIGTEVPA